MDLIFAKFLKLLLAFPRGLDLNDMNGLNYTDVYAKKQIHI